MKKLSKNPCISCKGPIQTLTLCWNYTLRHFVFVIKRYIQIAVCLEKWCKNTNYFHENLVWILAFYLC